MRAAPPLRVLVVLLAAFVVCVVALVVLYVATPPAQRGQVGHYLPAVGTAIAGAVPAVLAWLNTRGVKATQQDHAQQLAVIGENTNGRLDARIRAGVRAELTDAGLIAPASVTPVTVPEQAPASVAS